MIKILIKENKQLLNEIKLEQVLERFESPKFLKAVENYHDYLAEKYGVDNGYVSQIVASTVIIEIRQCVPIDIKEKYKAEALNWIITIFINTNMIPVSDSRQTSIRRLLETFYQIKESKMDRILRINDIYLIKSVNEFSQIIHESTPAWEEYKVQKLDKDADTGTNKIYEDNEWQIFIPENKGAACKLGKGTDWCTAAPGLNYYYTFHSKEDPLIIFISKIDKVPRTNLVDGKEVVTEIPEKLQFHYKTNQFADYQDNRIGTMYMMQLNLILFKALVNNQISPNSIPSSGVTYHKILEIEQERKKYLETGRKGSIFSLVDLADNNWEEEH